MKSSFKLKTERRLFNQRQLFYGFFSGPIYSRRHDHLKAGSLERKKDCVAWYRGVKKWEIELGKLTGRRY